MKHIFIKIQDRYILIDDITRISTIENRLTVWLALAPPVDFFFDSENAAKNACDTIIKYLDDFVLVKIN